MKHCVYMYMLMVKVLLWICHLVHHTEVSGDSGETWEAGEADDDSTSQLTESLVCKYFLSLIL